MSSIPGSGDIPWSRKWHHSSTLAWRIPWTEESEGLQLIGLQTVGYDSTRQHYLLHVPFVSRIQLCLIPAWLLLMKCLSRSLSRHLLHSRHSSRHQSDSRGLKRQNPWPHSRQTHFKYTLCQVVINAVEKNQAEKEATAFCWRAEVCKLKYFSWRRSTKEVTVVG